jgi:hypothetical protein
MRILRLRLAHFRAVAEREIEPLPTGVTVVQGPNEIGKSSLAEALDLLFDVRSDSRSRRVKAVQPVGADVGSEVEAEVEAGELRFVYFKRFHRDTETRLEVLSPRREALTGREAHDRALELLAGAIDVELWKALRIQQGESLAAVDVTKAGSLAAALDRAAQNGAGAGGAPAGEAGDAAAPEEDLFSRVQAQYERYYTPSKGQERPELRQAREEVAARVAEQESLAERLSQLEEELAELERLEAVTGELRASAQQTAAEAARQAERLAAIELLTARISELKRAVRAAEGREKCWRELAGLETEDEQHRTAVAAAEEQVAAAGLALEPLQAAATAAREAVETAADLLELRRRDERHRAQVAEAERLRRQRDAARQAAERVTALEARLAELWIDDGKLRRIEDAARALAESEGALGAGSPRLRLKALADLGLEVDGEARPLAAGETLEQQPTEPLRLTLPGQAEIELRPGGGVEELRAAVAKRKWELERHCAEAGVSNPQEARAVAADRRAVEGQLKEARGDHHRALDGQPAATVEARLDELEETIAADQAARRAEPPIAADADEARRQREAAETALDGAREGLEAAREALSEAQREADREALALQEAQGVRAALGQRRSWIEEQLAGWADELARAPRGGHAEAPPEPDGDAEAAGADGEAARHAEAAARAAAAARERLRDAERRLEDEQPEMVRVLADRSRNAARSKAAELAGTERRLHGLAERLKALGEQGLSEALDLAGQRRAAAERQRDDLLQRALAARALYRAMADARTAARASYLGPLQSRIEELGRPLYGDSFQVELDDELRLTRRILAGVALPVEELSAGAREQLGLLFRLACALLVSDDGGVPLILDDSLGHSDPERLAAMRGVLSTVGERCQVLILTSWPARFEGIAGARFLDFGPAG